ncbi:MAG: GMC family oxidoreductase [Gammaproteobacteria bacterium]|nr:GMC family oxidoreductase [Gammaproteobacteria bacterium]
MIAAHHHVVDGARLQTDQQLEADVVIVGTGAGGGVAAELLARSGLRVIMLETGPLQVARDFDMQEQRAYNRLYAEGGNLTTADYSIALLRGRAVGGGTTVNWTTSLRTPVQTVEYWVDRFGLPEVAEEKIAPWFDWAERRFNIKPWEVAPNANNEVLKTGCEKLGLEWAVIPRNVKGCADLGYCGMGCPLGAKQSMLVTTIPSALEYGASLYARTRAWKLEIRHGNVEALIAQALDEQSINPTGVNIRIRAKHYLLAGGAIQSPALLMRSGAPDPYRVLGKRSFLHPVNTSLARMPMAVDAFFGAPQSIYSDHYQWPDGAEGPAGFKLEVPPIHPGLAAGILGWHGEKLAGEMKELPRINALLALQRDGFDKQSPGGVVELQSDERGVLDYPLNEHLWDGVRRAWHAMAEIQFAAGAQAVMPGHLDAGFATSLAGVSAQIDRLPLEPYKAALFSAHLMGGCGMGANPRESVIAASGRHHQLENLTVVDGSVFPTSVGANPQLSIFAQAARMTTGLAREMQPGALADLP